MTIDNYDPRNRTLTILATTDNLTLQQNTERRRFQVLNGDEVVFESRQQAVAEVEYIARGGMLPIGMPMPRDRKRSKLARRQERIEAGVKV